MKPFRYVTAVNDPSARDSASEPGARFLAGGTTLVDLMKLNVEHPTVLVDINRLPFAAIEELADTSLPENPTPAGSMTAASTGRAVHAAALALRERLLTLSSNPTDLESCRTLVQKNDGRPIEAKADAKPGEERQCYSMHSFGAVFAEVRVDPDLGEIRVARVVGTHAAGRIINAKMARSQLVGGIVDGLAVALTEHTAIDPRPGRYVNADLGEYLVPVSADVPEIDVVLVDEHDPHVNPIGVKGIGEIGTTGVAAAVANAVYHATGVRVRDLPITIDKLLSSTGARP